MNLKPEIIDVLIREKTVSEAAIVRLQEKIRPLELQYGWSTGAFLKKFDSGEAGDEQTLFRWYALAEALTDWQKTRDSLAELLHGSELVSA